MASAAERRTRLAEAAWRIILDQGIGAVSVRTVAAEAGMAAGSLRHVFPTQAALLEFAAELVVERATARVTAVVPLPDPVAYAEAVICEVLPLTAESRGEFEVNIALIAETPAHPGLARIRDHAHAELIDLFSRIVAMVRSHDAPTGEDAREGRRLLALADGLGLHLLHRPPGEGEDETVEIVRAELRRIAAL